MNGQCMTVDNSPGQFGAQLATTDSSGHRR